MFVAGTLTKRALPSDGLRVLDELTADVVVIPEFGAIERIEQAVRHELTARGYSLHATTYRASRSHGSGLAVLSRLPVISFHEIEIGSKDRYMVELVIKNKSGKKFRVLAVHLDDRREAYRLKEVQGVCDFLTAAPALPTLLAGDFNAMHKTSWLARCMRQRIVRVIAKCIPHKHIASMLSRVHEMACGTTIDYLETHTELRSLDPGLQRTVSAKQARLQWAPAWRVGKIDWIFGSREFQTISYQVWRDVGSDHRPVRAELEYGTV